MPVASLDQVQNTNECRRVLITGEFDPDHTFFLGPRPPPINTPSNMPRSGAYVVTLFTLTNGERIFVNRGWVPKQKANVSSIRCPSGCVKLICVCSTAEKPNAFSVKHLDEKNMGKNLFWLDTTTLANSIGESNPIVVMDELGDETDLLDAIPLRKQEGNYVDFRVSPLGHATYSATWFTLAACGAVLTRNRFKRKF